MAEYTLEIDTEWTLAAIGQIASEPVTIPAGEAFYHAIRTDEDRPSLNYSRFEYHDGRTTFAAVLGIGDRLWLATRRQRIRTVIERGGGSAADATTAANAALSAVNALAPNVRKNNFDATRAPLLTDDATQGYEPGSRWLWQGQEWAYTGAAWFPINELSPRHFGAVDGVNSRAAFQAAADLGIPIVVPPGDYHIDGVVTLRPGTRFVATPGAAPTIRQTSSVISRLFNISAATGAALIGLSIIGGVASGETVLIDNTAKAEVRSTRIQNMPAGGNGGILLTNGAYDNIIEDNEITGAGGNGIGLAGSNVHSNRIRLNRFAGGAGFCIFVAGGAHRNLIEGNFTRLSELELVGVTRGCKYNRIIGNHAEGCGDNGISVTGEHNTVSGNVCIGNDLNGIFLYGSYNTVVGNVCLNNGQATAGAGGIAIQPVFSGCGQFNVIEGNTLADNQAARTQSHGVRVMNRSYADWAAGGAVALNTYVVSGMRVYRATAAGTTGPTPPTHTTGTVSDGGVSWEYTNTFEGVAQTAGNIIGQNIYGPHVSGDILFQSEDLNHLWKADDLRIGNRDGNADVRLYSAATGEAAIYANDGADVGWIKYSHAANTWDFRAFSTDVLTIHRDYLQTRRGVVRNRRFTGVDTTVTSADHIIGVTSTTSPRTITLPASGRVVGQEVIIADESGGAATNNITIGGGGANINGVPSITIAENYGVRAVYWTGTQWVAK